MDVVVVTEIFPLLDRVSYHIRCVEGGLISLLDDFSWTTPGGQDVANASWGLTQLPHSSWLWQAVTRNIKKTEQAKRREIPILGREMKEVIAGGEGWRRCQGYFFKMEHVCCWEWSRRQGPIIQGEELMKRVIRQVGDGDQQEAYTSFSLYVSTHPWKILSPSFQGMCSEITGGLENHHCDGASAGAELVDILDTPPLTEHLNFFIPFT